MTVHLTIIQDAPEPELSRDQVRSRRHRDVRAKTINLERESKQDGEFMRLVVPEAGEDYWRPRTRLDCADVPRPCPYVGCAHNLYLDVGATKNESSIKFNFPDLDPVEMPPGGSCALDVVERGGQTLEEVGILMNVTRERVRQIEAKAVRRLEKRMARFKDHAPGFADFAEIIPPQLPIVRRDAVARLGLVPTLPAMSIPRAIDWLADGGEQQPAEEPAEQEDDMPRCTNEECGRITRPGKLKEPPAPGTEGLCGQCRDEFLKGVSPEPQAEEAPSPRPRKPRGKPKAKAKPKRKPYARRAESRPTAATVVASQIDVPLSELIEVHRLMGIVGMNVIRDLAQRIEGTH